MNSPLRILAESPIPLYIWLVDILSTLTMRYEQELKLKLGTGALLGLGFALIAFSTIRVIQSDASLTSFVIGIAIPGALAIVLFAGAIGMFQYGLTDHSLRIATWTCSGVVVMILAVILDIIALEFLQPGFDLALYIVTTAAAAGAVLGFLIGMYDAHQRQIQQNLARKRDEATLLTQRLSVLNRVLRHDLRTQAQLLYGDAGQLEAGTLSSEQAAAEIRTKADRLSRLSAEANQLHEVFDGGDIETETCDIVSLVREAGDVVQAAHNDLAIEYDVPEKQLVEAPPMFTHAVQQLFYNVVQHTNGDDPRAEVSVSTVDPANSSVQLTVADNGPGIPENELIHNDLQTESQLRHSKGLGLWLVTWIVDRGNGTLNIETHPSENIGTAVQITFPASSG
mgnify:CR=1 FL=1